MGTICPVESLAKCFRHESTGKVFGYWMSLNNGRMPAHRLWDPIDVPKHMPWSVIIERGGSSGFQIRFAGTAICDFYGMEMTGQAVGSRMDDEARAFYFNSLEEGFTRPCGRLFTVQARSDRGRDCLFECLSLPLADADGNGCRTIVHQVIIEEVTYGEAKTRFSLPEIAKWIDIGGGVPGD